ncbi:DUF6236 family protein [Pseudomonas sp. BJa5]|uniref:DUF6236 family protein n=1 Tax=Pseudomonas sp. BJa5 TaxID=2936270 RepID=UPI002559F1CD|nr:DUF6236 family protein [Pseudomonas sp. BGr12]MDL2419600.1 DUF6236 family protein [Pseudomonas sp. BGr12]
MGQAKQRKASDPNYGKYSSKPRGLIVFSPSSVTGNSFNLASTNLDQQELRSSLLYWDKLAWPKNNFIYTPNTAEIDELVRIGVMQTPTLPLSGGGAVEDVMTAAHEYALTYFENQAPGIWSAGEGINSFVNNNTAPPKSHSGTGLSLYNALPVPSADVPLVEILDFKDRRRAELLIFRAHLDAMAKEISSAGDSVDSLGIALKDLDAACSDLIKVTREWQFPVKLANVKASMNFNLATSASAAVTAWKNADSFNLDNTEKAIAAVAAGVASNFKINADVSFQKIKRPASPFKYLYQVTRELG